MKKTAFKLIRIVLILFIVFKAIPFCFYQYRKSVCTQENETRGCSQWIDSTCKYKAIDMYPIERSLAFPLYYYLITNRELDEYVHADQKRYDAYIACKLGFKEGGE